MKPYSRRTDTIVFRGKKMGLYLYYDLVLGCFDVWSCADLDDRSKMAAALDLLTNRNKNTDLLSLAEQAELHSQIFEEKINLNKRHSKPGPKTVDFIFDFDLIYAGFYQAYHIDLIDQRGLLTWYQFYNLFQGLPDNTKIKEVMGIRGRDIPSPTKYNQKEIQSLIELKQYWALPPDKNLENNYQTQVNQLFDAVKTMCGR